MILSICFLVIFVTTTIILFIRKKKNKPERGSLYATLKGTRFVSGIVCLTFLIAACLIYPIMNSSEYNKIISEIDELEETTKDYELSLSEYERILRVNQSINSNKFMKTDIFFTNIFASEKIASLDIIDIDDCIIILKEDK